MTTNLQFKESLRFQEEIPCNNWKKLKINIFTQWRLEKWKFQIYESMKVKHTKKWEKTNTVFQDHTDHSSNLIRQIHFGNVDSPIIIPIHWIFKNTDLLIYTTEIWIWIWLSTGLTHRWFVFLFFWFLWSPVWILEKGIWIILFHYAGIGWLVTGLIALNPVVRGKTPVSCCACRLSPLSKTDYTVI